MAILNSLLGLKHYALNTIFDTEKKAGIMVNYHTLTWNFGYVFYISSHEYYNFIGKCKGQIKKRSLKSRFLMLRC